jgi:ubiquinone/menaquinone biosynthesis C-methylase UbiE
VQIDPEARKQRTQAAFNAAAGTFDDPVASFWDVCGRRTVEVAGIHSGHRVLDVCCGTGSSALPAAEAVGDTGSVVGVDFAERLLERGRAKAKARGLGNVEFRSGDLTALDAADESFDGVLCVFGVFYVQDMVGAVRELWRVVRPGGVLAITTWGRRAFEPGDGVFWAAVGRERPDLGGQTPPWQRLVQPAVLLRLHADAGTAAPDVVVESFDHPIEPEDFWTIVLGSGYRASIDLMGAESAGRVREEVITRLRADAVRALSFEVLYSCVRK